MLQVTNIKAAYGNVEVLHGISFEVKPSECVALVGANGSGKTTTLKTICGLHKPTGGSIEFEGERIESLPGHQIVRRGITMCPEGRQVFPEMSVSENLLMGSYSRKDNDIANDIDEMLELFPVLGERKKQLAGTLSGGEQEMLAIARALMAKPKLCIFDEPSLGLAPKIVAEVEDTIAKIKERGMTILLVEQNSAMALRLADRAYVYEAGTIKLEGTGAELMTNPDVKKAYLSC